MPARTSTQRKRRALGQHFLRDKGIARRIAETAYREAVAHGCASLLEIGPGRGAITEPLLELIEATPRPMPLLLCERDRDLARAWEDKLPRHPRLELATGDFLELPEERWLSHPPLAVASNLPYSAGTAILTRLARHADRIPVMVLMFQAEVAHRLRAEPGTRSWGSLSIWLQNVWDVRKLCGVPPGAFAPPPEVDSEVVVLTRRPKPRIPVPEAAQDLWESLLKTAFSHRRKMLRSSLPREGRHRNALERAGVDGTKRAEALGWEEWDSFFQALRK